MDGNMIQKTEEVIGDADFPAHKNDLVKHAQSKGASSEVMGMLQKLPSQSFSSVAEVVKKIGSSIL